MERVVCRPLFMEYRDHGKSILLVPKKDTFSKLIVPPLFHPQVFPPRAEIPLQMPDIEQLTEDQVIELLETFVSNSMTNSFNAISDIYIKDINMCDVFIYTMTTCTETRSTMWMYCPFIAGGSVDGPTDITPTPDPWSVPIDPQFMVVKKSKPIIIPHSERVSTCHTCTGRGRVTCSSCGGFGTTSSTSTDSEGRSTTTTSTCFSCGGSGKVTCGSCQAHCFIKLFLTVKAFWTTKTTTRVVDTSESKIKDKSFLSKESTTILAEDCETVPYIAEHFDDSNRYQESLVKVINQVISSHELEKGSMGRVVVQKQVIKHLPLAVINYSYKEKTGKFYVVGNERKVKFDDYPTKNCTIL